MTEQAKRRGSYCLWRFRMWLGGLLLDFGCRIEPEFRSCHRYSEDGQTITMWREPT